MKVAIAADQAVAAGPAASVAFEAKRHHPPQAEGVSRGGRGGTALRGPRSNLRPTSYWGGLVVDDADPPGGAVLGEVGPARRLGGVRIDEVVVRHGKIFSSTGLVRTMSLIVPFFVSLVAQSR